MAKLFALGVLLTFLGASQAVTQPNFGLPDNDYESFARTSFIDGQFFSSPLQIRKRDLEFNQYVPAYRLRGEPSCEELRAMWRLSKREARRATSTNNLPRSRPYSYGRLIAFAPSRRVSRPFIYGEPRNFASKNGFSSPVKGAFNRLRNMGVGAGRPGSFQKIRGMVAAQRLPGETSKGKFNILRDMVLDSHAAKDSPPEEIMAGSTNLRTSEVYQPVRRTPSSMARFRMEQRPAGGFVGPLLKGNSAVISPFTSEWRRRIWNSRTKSCLQTEGMNCHTNSECACAGQYRCSSGRCKVYPIYPEIEDELVTWFSDTLPMEELGISSLSRTDD